MPSPFLDPFLRRKRFNDRPRRPHAGSELLSYSVAEERASILSTTASIVDGSLPSS